MRRLIKTPSDESISTNLLIDYVNRFYTMDVASRMNLFDLKTTYQFLTTPGVDQYNMPLYSIQQEPDQAINYYPVYQGFEDPCFVNGIPVGFFTQRAAFNNVYPKYFQSNLISGYGNGGAGPYNLAIPSIANLSSPQNLPSGAAIMRGHVDITGVIKYAETFTFSDPPIGPTDGTSISVIPTTSVIPAVYFTSTGSDGTNIVVADSGQFLENNQNQGLLMVPGQAPYGNTPSPHNYAQSFAITGVSQANPAVVTSTSSFSVGQKILIDGVLGMTELNGNYYIVTAVTPTTFSIDVDSTSFTMYSSGGSASSILNTINYFTGIAENVFFPGGINAGLPIYAQCYYYQLGIPRSIQYYNNVISVRPPPNTQYVVELTGYLSPAAFLSSGQGVSFAYMSEYIARGAARKLLSDQGDWDQFNQYEPLYREQEQLVWARSQRQFTSTRTQTIYSNRGGSGTWGIGNGLGLQ